eukprot:GHVN01030786.1.p1 GENE.GHVN01030786.1~~GHVN01030786.1.p1  ORF type:complete len:204 (+),score=20.78 GHVN01030786.1:133-744(+)
MAADPWWMCKLVGLCKDPPVYEGQPQWWRDVRRPTASLWSAEEETLAPRSIHLKPPPPPSQTLIPSQQHNHSLQPPASALPLQTPSPYKRISLPPAGMASQRKITHQGAYLQSHLQQLPHSKLRMASIGSHGPHESKGRIPTNEPIQLAVSRGQSLNPPPPRRKHGLDQQDLPRYFYASQRQEPQPQTRYDYLQQQNALKQGR